MQGVQLSVFLPSLLGGGAERAFVNLANSFADDGYVVDMVLASARGPYIASVSRRVRVVDLKCHRVFPCVLKLSTYLRRERPTALLSALSHSNVVAIGAHFIARVPTTLVVSERCKIVDEMRVSRKDRILLRLMQLTYHRATKVVAVSRGVAEDVEQIIGVDPQKISVIYNPVVTAELLETAAESVAHPWFSAPGRPVILGAGRLSAQKDFVTLIQAFSIVRKKQPARLVILGEGEKRNELELLAHRLDVADDVWMPGFVENPFPWMRSATLFVLSSRFEGLPNVLIQAMACGTPVVSTNCPGGPAEILEKDRLGRLVPVGDAPALAAAMTASLSEPPNPAAQITALGFTAKKAHDMYADVLFG